MGDSAAALMQLKNGKVGGSSNILPEIVKAACCKEDFMILLLDLIHTVRSQFDTLCGRKGGFLGLV